MFALRVRLEIHPVDGGYSRFPLLPVIESGNRWAEIRDNYRTDVARVNN
jgi:hypothetical protein